MFYAEDDPRERTFLKRYMMIFYSSRMIQDEAESCPGMMWHDLKLLYEFPWR